MVYEQEVYRKKLLRWQRYMERFHLPTWEELPDLELYMDQVVGLVNRYLDLIPHDEKNPVLTPSAVNNYVRLKVLPPPVRKRYGRKHLAFLILICTLKQSMSLADIQGQLSADAAEEEVRQTYNDFVDKVGSTIRLFIPQVNEAAAAALVPENEHGCDSLVLYSAVSSVLYKLLTVKLINLRNLNLPLDSPELAPAPEHQDSPKTR